MEHIYFDEIHKRGADGKSVFLKTLIVGGCVLLCPIVFLLAGQFGLLLSAGVIYGGYLLFQRLNREYEYIYTDGEVDIDVIYGRQSRKRLLTLKNRQIVAMGKYQKEKVSSYRAAKVLDCSDARFDCAYYVVLGEGHEKTLVIFSPSERLVDTMKYYLRDRFLAE